MSLLQSLLAEIGFLNYDSGLQAVSKTTDDFATKNKKEATTKSKI